MSFPDIPIPAPGPKPTSPQPSPQPGPVNPVPKTDPDLLQAKVYRAAEYDHRDKASVLQIQGSLEAAKLEWLAAADSVQKLIKLIAEHPEREKEFDNEAVRPTQRLSGYLQNAGQLTSPTGQPTEGGGGGGWLVAGALVAGILAWKYKVFKGGFGD